MCFPCYIGFQTGYKKVFIAAAAYRAGEKITNEQTGIIHDYTKKQSVAKSVIILPENAPEEYYNRSTLWNTVEKMEKTSNNQLAREIELALPKELSYFQNTSLAFEYVKENFTSKGMIADINFHNMKSDNPHVHIMLTMRPFNEDGTWGDKQKKVYHLDKNGDKIYDPVKRTYKCSKQQTTDWSERHKTEEWRESWAGLYTLLPCVKRSNNESVMKLLGNEKAVTVIMRSVGLSGWRIRVGVKMNRVYKSKRGKSHYFRMSVYMVYYPCEKIFCEFLIRTLPRTIFRT